MHGGNSQPAVARAPNFTRFVVPSSISPYRPDVFQTQVFEPNRFAPLAGAESQRTNDMILGDTRSTSPICPDEPGSARGMFIVRVTSGPSGESTSSTNTTLFGQLEPCALWMMASRFVETVVERQRSVAAYARDRHRVCLVEGRCRNDMLNSHDESEDAAQEGGDCTAAVPARHERQS